MNLTTGYRVVGGLIVAYGLLMFAFVFRIVATSPASWDLPGSPLEWVLVVSFLLHPIALLVGGALLYTRSPACLRAAVVALIVAGVLLLAQAAHLVVGTARDYETGPGWSEVVVVNILAGVLPAVAFAALAIATAGRLGSQLRVR